MKPLGLELQTLKRSNAVEDVINTFRAAIISGELRLGQRLPSEAVLSAQLGVGRGTVREAMKKLEAIGVVTIQPGDGTYIVDKIAPTQLSPLVFAIMLEAGTGVDLLELRSLLEVGYCQLAAQKATAADWERIEAAEEAFAAYAREPQVDAEHLTRLDLEFHFALLDATHNPLLEKIGRTVEELFFASILSTLMKMENREWGIEGHHAILEATRRADLQGIYRAVNDSLKYWADEVKKL